MPHAGSSRSTCKILPCFPRVLMLLATFHSGECAGQARFGVEIQENEPLRIQLGANGRVLVHKDASISRFLTIDLYMQNYGAVRAMDGDGITGTAGHGAREIGSGCADYPSARDDHGNNHGVWTSERNGDRLGKLSTSPFSNGRRRNQIDRSFVHTVAATPVSSPKLHYDARRA